MSLSSSSTSKELLNAFRTTSDKINKQVKYHTLKFKRRKSSTEKLEPTTPSEIKILAPFRHTIHVDSQFTWSGESVEESFSEIKLLGEGSYGCVYKSSAPGGKIVAIKKVLFDEEDEKKQQEKNYSVSDKNNHPTSDNIIDNNNNNNSNSNSNDSNNNSNSSGSSNGSSNSSFDSKTSDSVGLNESEQKKLSFEIELLKRISSPYVVQYYGSRWKSKRELWIIMEYCKFGSVRDVMDYVNADLLLENQISTILQFTLQGLNYLHSLTPPIVHFDIKANNLLLANDGTVKVCSFFEIQFN